MKNTLKVVANIFLVILLIIGFVVAFSLIPIKNNYKILSVMSGSMEPAIKTGELIVIKPANSYDVGNIVTYQNKGANGEKSTTTHRITEKKMENGEELFRAKGDANNTIDAGWIKNSDIIGRYRFGVKYFGYLIRYIKTLPGLILIIIIPATIIILEEVKKIHRESKEIISKRRAKKKDAKKISKNSDISKTTELKTTNYKLAKGGGNRVAKDKKNN